MLCEFARLRSRYSSMNTSLAVDNRSRPIIAFIAVTALIGMAWAAANWIVTGSLQALILGGMAIALIATILATLNDWRVGILLFIPWLLFEDLPRKYLGNGLILFFGKDILIAVTYISLWHAKRRNEISWLRTPFLLPLALFFTLAFIQVFNTWTPSVLYGFLGLKLDFYYVPLLYAGYALIGNAKDLERFLIYNVALGLLIASLGIVQSVVGLKFLNPASLAPELETLGNLTRYSPLTHQAVPQPTSVFVSTGRFATYTILLGILAFGMEAYLLLKRPRQAWYGLLGVGITIVAAMQSGSRGAVIYLAISMLVLSAGFFWGSPWQWTRHRPVMKAVRRSFLVGAVGLFTMIQFFPRAIGASWAFYSETLSPTSSASELQNRTWDYPLRNLRAALEHPRWLYGDGTGTASLGMQYVAKVLGQPPIDFWVENGWGTLILEMGILGPILWIIWTFWLLWFAWKTVRRLRESVYFPLALSIFWYAFILLVPISYNGMAPYQNYVMNAYLWLLLGVLFRLPDLLRNEQVSMQALRLSQVSAAAVYAG